MAGGTFRKWTRRLVSSSAAAGLGFASVWRCTAAVLAKERNEAGAEVINADVVIVGAGISGMACAAKLTRQGRRVVVLEASHHIGGRIRAVNETEFASFGGDDDSADVVPWHHRRWLRVHRNENAVDRFGVSDFNFELGAEFVHGPQSAFMEEIKAQQIPHHELFTWAHGDGGPSEEASHAGGIGVYWDGTQKKLQRYDELDQAHKAAIDALWAMPEIPPESLSNDTRTLHEYLVAKGVPESGIAFAEAGYANTVCGTLNKISVARMCQTERNWLHDGDGDYRISDNKTLYTIFEGLMPGVDIRLRTPVTSVRQSDDGKRVIVHAGGSSNPVKVIASAAVVTASIPVLQRKIILFDPPLPSATEEAIGSLLCEPAVKIMAKFSERFWPAEVEGTVCSEAFAPEMWFDSKVKDQGPYYVTAFFTSDQARRISNLATSKAFQGLQDQLGEMFNAADMVRKSYCGGFIIDWGAVPWIWGAYTTPSTREHQDAREHLARPHWNGKLHFAGEATDPFGFMTAHSAFATGLRAAKAADAAV